MRTTLLVPAFMLLAAGCGRNDGPLDEPWVDTTDAGVIPGVDSDGDGLDDVFELSAGDLSVLDPARADTDGDGTADGLEDPDQDGLTNLEEQAAQQHGSVPANVAFHPLRVDLMVELDVMAGITVTPSQLERVSGAYGALPTMGGGGQSGVGMHFFLDETALPAQDLNTGQRPAFLAGHPPAFSAPAGFPKGKMLHAALVHRQSDRPALLAETVSDDDAESSGVLVYLDAIDDAHPACNGSIQVEDVVVGALVHELGHTLQLGHDTDVGGGINPYNIMALATSCAEANQRYHGTGNTDATLGNTEAVNQSRFSDAAARLMQFRNKVSVETGTLVDADGVEM